MGGFTNQSLFLEILSTFSQTTLTGLPLARQSGVISEDAARIWAADHKIWLWPTRHRGMGNFSMRPRKTPGRGGAGGSRPSFSTAKSGQAMPPSMNRAASPV